MKELEIRQVTGLHKGIKVLFVLMVTIAAAFVISCFPGQQAYADLSVYVGYAGGPYYKKAYFTDSELWSMADSAVYEYSSIDQGNFLRKGFGQGVKINTLFEAANINPNAIWRFHMDTQDNYVKDDKWGYALNGEAWSFNELCARARYYYPDYPACSFFDNGHPYVFNDLIPALNETAVQVPSILALRSSFNRVTYENDPIWTDSSSMGSWSGYRLMYGQTDPLAGDARNTAQLVNAIIVILGGRDPGNEGRDLPIIDFVTEDSKIEANVGDEITLKVHISNVMDQTILKQMWADIVIESEDKDVFTVRKNADGTVTLKIVGEGQAGISARYGTSTNDEFISYGGSGLTISGNGTGAGDDGDGDESGGDGSDPNGTGKHDRPGADSIQLGPGTMMTPIFLNSTASNGTESGASGLKAGAQNIDDPADETLVSEDVSSDIEAAPEIEIEVKKDDEFEPEPEVSELILDELDPMAEKYPQSTPVPWWLGIALGSCVAIGGGRKFGSYEMAKDRQMDKVKD